MHRRRTSLKGNQEHGAGATLAGRCSGRARFALRRLYLVRAELELLGRRTRGLRAETVEEGLDLQDLGRRAGSGDDDGYRRGKVLLQRSRRRSGAENQ